MKVAPLPEDEASRLTELTHYKILDTLPEEAFDDLTALAAQICGAPIALVSLVDAHRQWFKSKVGIDASETPRDIAFCAHAIHQSDIFIVPDAAQDERFADNPLVTQDPNIRFYAGVPLITPKGHAMGTLCVIDRRPHQLTPAQQEALRKLGRQVVRFMELRIYGREREQAEAQEAENADRLRRVQTGLLELSTNATIYRGQLDEAYQLITRIAAQTIRVARTSIWFYTQERTAIRRANLYEQPADRHSSSIELSAAAFPRYFAELAMDRVIAADQAQTDPRTAEFAESYLIPIGITSMLDVPIRVGGSMVGVMRHEHIGPPRQWTLEEEQFATSVANTVSLVLEAADRRHAEEALRRSEERTRLIIDTALDAVVSMDGNGLITGWNRQAATIFGWTADEVLGREITETMIPPQYRDDHRKGMKQFLQTGQGPVMNHRVEITALRRDGTEFPVELTITPIRLDDGYAFTAFISDISDRKRVQREMEETQQFLTSMIENLPIMVFAKSADDLKFVRWNRAAEYVTGYTRDEMLGKSDYDLFTKDEADFFTAKDREILASGTLLEIPEEQIHTKERGVRILRTKKLPVLDEQGRSHFLLGIAEDITERKLADEALRASEERLALTVQASNVGIWDWDLATNAMYLSPQWKGQLGYEDTEIVNAFGEWESRLHPDDRNDALHTLHTFISGWTAGFESEFRLRHKDGSYRWILSRSAVIRNPYGVASRIVGIHIDTTDARRAEEALRTSSLIQKAILDHAGHAIISTSPDGVIQTFNPAAESLLGYAANEVIGTQTPALFHDPEEVAARAQLFSAELGAPIAPGFDVFVEKSRRGLPNDHEWTYIRKDGTRLTVLLNVTALWETDGSIVGFLGMASDITERKIAERELTKAKEAAEAASVAKSQFLANMSHEIRTPMNGVIGMSDLMLSTPLTERQRHLAEAVHRSASALLDIINDILDFSKIEAGKLHLEQIEFDLARLCNDVAELFVEPVRKKGVELVCHVAESLKIRLIGDPVRLRQILINLLSNAVKFTERGKIALVLDQVEEDEQGILLRLEVRDTGIGIPLDAQRRIFQAFDQADTSTTRKYGGTGLGLAIVSRLVEMMNGVIGVESVPGQGTTFRAVFRLPKSVGNAAPPPGDSSSTPLTRKTAPLLAHFHASILLAEDNAINREVALGILEMLGCRVHAVANGRLAVDAITAQPYDLVLMDCQMPEMDGFRATALIREQEAQSTPSRHVPIIALTANAMEGDRERCLAAGMDDYLSKPFTLDQLHNLLVQWMSRGAKEALTAPPAIPTPELSLDVTTQAVDRDAWENILALQQPDQPDLLARIMRLYLKDSQELVDKIQAAADSHDAHQLRESSHSLKSRSATLGAMRVAEICKELETRTRTHQMDEAPKLASDLKEAFAAACDVLQTELQKRAPR